MSDQLFEAAGIVGLILWGMTLAVTVLHDTRREPRAVLAPVPVTGTTGNGVPWVAGP